MPRLILIVDDNAMNRQILGNTLRKDYDVLEAQSGEEALEVLRRNRDTISALLLDIVMPGIDGYEVLRRIRSDDDLAGLPVIMVTGSEDEESRVKAISIGANDFILKPFNPEIVLHCLKNNIALHETIKTVSILQRDHLTGLYIREAFFEKVQEMVSSQKPGYYIMACFDVDRFKVINDQYGTEKGDEVLRYIAETFKACFNENGGIVCRVSADDFAVLYPASFVQSDELEEIRRRASSVPGILSPVVFSIGRYLVDDLSLTPIAMYDRAMLAAESVKGQYNERIAFYDEALRKRLLDEQSIVNEMKSAIDTRQFEVWYQPQYNHSTGALIGAEALVRWRHPKKGLISPGIFIPIFEKNGFIYNLDKYVWEEVCHFLRRGLDNGYSPLPISVNISRYDLFCSDVVDVITGLIKKYNLPVDLLRLEITESAFSESTKEIVSVVKQLIAAGFTLEIDDFGSGYSSLNTLKSVPAHIVKLDMRFFEEDDGTGRSGNIIESVVRMVGWLGMSVIAEGVEEKEHADFLSSIGCDYIQGYLYSRPIPETEYIALAKRNTNEEKLLTIETVKTLDNSAFWDPKSMDTLIFNNYVGGALIFDYRNGDMKLLRVNDRYIEELGKNITRADIFAHQPLDYMDGASRKIALEGIRTAIETGKEATFETYSKGLYGTAGARCIRTTIRAIAKAGNRYLLYGIIMNVTEQRETERKERELSDQLNAIMRSVNSGVSAMTLDESLKVTMLFANDKYYEMLGYTRQQYAAEVASISDVVFTDDKPIAKGAVAKLLKDGIPSQNDYRCVRRDGSIVYIRASKSLANMRDYTKPVVISVITDITELVQAERRVSKLLEQLQTIMSGINGGVSASVVTGTGVKYLYKNDQYTQQFGYTPEQFDAEVSNAFMLIHPDDRDRVIQEAPRLTTEHTAHSITYRIIRRDGVQRWIQSNISVMRLADMGDVPIQLSVNNDITEQLEAQQGERRVSEQMKAIMDNVDVGITATVVNDADIRFLFVNDRYYAMLGYTREQYEKEVTDHFAPAIEEDRDNLIREANRLSKLGDSAVVEYRVIRRDGSVAWIKAALSMGRFSDVDGLVQLAICRDITAEKAAELEKREANRQVQQMMDNLPCGAGIYEYKDGIMSLVYQNKSYWELVGLYEADFTDTSRMSAIHPDDIPAVMRELSLALSEGRDVSCNVRLRHLTLGHRAVHLAGRIVQRNTEGFLIYATFVPLPDIASE